MEQENITERLIDYIDGKLSAEDRAEIRDWLENDPNLLAEYEQLRKLLRQMDQPLPEVPSGKMTQRFESWLESQDSKPKTRTLSRTLSGTYLYRIAASVLVLILAGGAWWMVQSSLDQKKELARLQLELKQTRQLMLDQLNDDQSASQRMLGVYATNTLSTADDEIIDALANTMESDASSNVRLAALEALSRFYQDPKVKQLLIKSLNRQKDPVVQIALIQLLVQMKEKSILSDLERLSRQNHPVKAVKDEAYKGIFKLT
jgi:hypothetical protein